MRGKNWSVPNLMRLSPFVVVLILFVVSPAAAQDPVTSPADHVHEPARGAGPAESPAWSWSPDANVFFGYNYQQREFSGLLGLGIAELVHAARRAAGWAAERFGSRA